MCPALDFFQKSLGRRQFVGLKKGADHRGERKNGEFLLRLPASASAAGLVWPWMATVSAMSAACSAEPAMGGGAKSVMTSGFCGDK